MEKKCPFDSIYTDFSKTFVSVNHKLLLVKLKSFGITGTFLEWFGSYLFGQIQYVIYKNYISEGVEVLSGVPQGSHLGPLTFIR